MTHNSYVDGIELAVFSGKLNSICEEMGYVLQRSALSPNIKDRLDFSCAFFDKKGQISAQAAHIPVHLGSMAYAMTDLVVMFDWNPGDVVILNDPFMGGTHLPDVTVISPFFLQDVLQGFLANRAHHANIGSKFPGSMPLSTDLQDEGVLIAPAKLFERGKRIDSVARLVASIEASCLDNDQLPGDFQAQISANQTGLKRLTEWLACMSDSGTYLASGLDALNAYGKQLAEHAFREFPHGIASFTDHMDGDGFDDSPVPVTANVRIDEHGVSVDFKGTGRQVNGNINCPMSVCAAAVYYVFVCLLPAYVPRCHGVFQAITIRAPEGSLVSARAGAAVAAGNVETSMRIVDVILGALAKLGLRVPAAAHGSMNNVALGGRTQNQHWDYYETIGGGMGGGPEHAGRDAIQCHMTNTLNTPIESLELHYPLRIVKYAIRRNSGGEGLNSGGNGIERVYHCLQPTSVTLLTERRVFSPWGLCGGRSGKRGINCINNDITPGKRHIQACAGDRIRILTPGGGGWGRHVTST